MASQDHTPDPHSIGSSVSRTDGSHVAFGTCTRCEEPIRRVAGFAILAEDNPNPWTIYDPADRTPLAEIAPVPEAGVTVTGADSLDNEEHAGLRFRMRDGDRWHILADVSDIDETCHITLTTSEGKFAKVWATRQIQIRQAARPRRTYRYNGFTDADAQELNGAVVTITTHIDPETEQPGEMLGPYRLAHVAGKSYLWLLPADAKGDDAQAERAVFLIQVAAVQIHELNEVSSVA